MPVLYTYRANGADTAPMARTHTPAPMARVRIAGVSDPRGEGVNRIANSLSNLGLNLLA